MYESIPQFQFFKQYSIHTVHILTRNVVTVEAENIGCISLSKQLNLGVFLGDSLKESSKNEIHWEIEGHFPAIR